MATLDDDHPGTRNGGRARGRRRRRKQDDERPRGFQPQRMRRIWDDIDDARDKLGLGAAVAAPSTWGVGPLVGRALEATAGATNRALAVTADATNRALAATAGVTTWVSGFVPASLQRACGVTDWLTELPIVGRLLARLPGVASRAD